MHNVYEITTSEPSASTCQGLLCSNDKKIHIIPYNHSKLLAVLDNMAVVKPTNTSKLLPLSPN